MTITDALIAAIQVPGLTSVVLEKACIDAGLTGSDTYAKADEKSVDMAALSVLQGLVVENEKEGGFSFAISKDALEARINFLLNKWDVTDPTINPAISNQPKVNAARVW